MKKISVIICLAVSLMTLLPAIGSYGQLPEGQTLDSRRYEAWFVEYEPYRLLIETAIDEYRQLSQETLPSAGVDDVFILIRSRSGTPPGLYQIWYGNSSEGFTRLSPRQVDWILGETLESTLADKGQYYTRDTDIPFRNSSNLPELEYIDNKKAWTRSDVTLSLENITYLFGNQGGISYNWGNEHLARPYGLMGQTKIGVLTPIFSLGMLTPSLLTFYNGYVMTDSSSAPRLNGSWGGFGSFQFDQYYGELGFTSLQGIPTLDPTVSGRDGEDIYYIDIYALATIRTGLKIAQIGQAVTVNLGGLAYRVTHQEIDTDNEQVHLQDNFYRGGLFVRADLVTQLKSAGYPQFESALQLIAGSGVTVMGTATYNFNNMFGVPVKLIYFGTDDIWDPKFTAFVGFNVNLDTN